MSESTCFLLHLPSDVILDIFTFSQPFEILRLRQTCTVFKDLSHERSIWVHFFRLFIHAAQFPLEFFSIDNMSSTELEAAATVPLRFLQNFAHDRPESRAKVHRIQGNGKIHSLDLVPGDRYLAFISGSRVVLWDLGVIGNRDAESVPRIVAHIQCDIPKKQRPWILTETKGKDILVMVTSNEWAGTWTVVYKIDPSLPLPKFERVAALRTKLFSYNVCDFEADKMLVIFSSSQSGNHETQDVWLWDFETNRLINWLGEPGKIDCIFVAADRIVLLLDPEDSLTAALEAQVFALPQLPLNPFDMSPQDSHTIPKPFLRTLDLRKDLPNPEDLVLFQTATDWSSPVGMNFSFDMIAYFPGYEESYQCTILRKVLQPCKDNPSILEAVTEHQAIYEGDMYIPPNVQFQGFDFFHDDLRMLSWPDSAMDQSTDSTLSTRLVCHLSSFTGSSSEEQCKTLYVHNQTDSDFEYTFSARTGRLCFISGSWGTDITYYDYGTL
ncbi:hypothetical protein DL96DRAFT_1595581 [Flagelloscypha sp. PMI_526]|nr:hypothetical protein DL96DRAFT_1595581 [Flagelloscypha sp. PMI_526]